MLAGLAFEDTLAQLKAKCVCVPAHAPVHVPALVPVRVSRWCVCALCVCASLFHPCVPAFLLLHDARLAG